MNILALNGSPSKNGNTAALLGAFCGQVGGDVKIINCYGLPIAACTDCRFCYQNPGCATQDAMQGIYDGIALADVVVLATPMHFGICSAPLFALITRLQSCWAQWHIRGLPPAARGKYGVLLASCGARWPNMELLLNGLSELAFQHMGVTEVLGRVYAKQTDKLAAKDNEAALAQARRLAREINLLVG